MVKQAAEAWTNSYLVNDYWKLRNHQHQNNHNRRHNHKLSDQATTAYVRPFAKENNHVSSWNKTKNITTGYKSINNKIELAKPQKEILILHLKQDELIKEGLKNKKLKKINLFFLKNVSLYPK